MSFEVADKELLATDGDVAGFSHVVATIEPTDQLARLGDDEDGGRDGVDGHDVSGRSDRQAGYDVDVADRDLADKMAWAGKWGRGEEENKALETDDVISWLKFRRYKNDEELYISAETACWRRRK